MEPYLTSRPTALRARRTLGALLSGGLLLSAAVAGPAAAQETAVPQPRGTDDSCPDGVVPDDGFSDVRSSVSVHEYAVDCVAWWGVAAGRDATTFDPRSDVTRAQMASFVVRAVEAGGGQLPESPPDAFGDDDGSVHEASINALAAVGVVGGTGEGRFSPHAAVTRGQMASFLAGAAEHRTGAPLPATREYFSDVSTSVHRENVNRVAQAGFTGGFSDGTYRPASPVSREQMATFLARFLDLVVENGLAERPDQLPPYAFPPEAFAVHGGQDWAVYLYVTEDYDDPGLDEARSRLEAIGYSPAGGSLACDDGAHEALGLDPARDYGHVAAYLESEQDADQFLLAFDHDVEGVAHVTTYCLD